MQVERFEHEGHQLAYEVYGEAERTVVLLHGLLLGAGINRAVARLLAEFDYRVVLPELLGHGRADKPPHAYAHRLEFLGEQTLALLDHLDLDEAVVGGTSLGANIALQVAVTDARRLRGLLLEMPVLERGAVPASVFFVPLLLGLRYGGAVADAVLRLGRSLPPVPHEVAQGFLEDVFGDRREMAAVLHGLLAGPVAPPARDRRRIQVPTLVVGHGFDLLHPLDDAEALAAELPDARLLRARSILELRTRPNRIVGEVAAFLDRIWSPAPPRAAAR